LSRMVELQCPEAKESQILLLHSEDHLGKIKTIASGCQQKEVQWEYYKQIYNMRDEMEDIPKPTFMITNRFCGDCYENKWTTQAA